MEQHEKFVRMTTAPVYGLVGRMAVPTMITMLITAFYNMADTFFVGLLDNTSATGAVGVVAGIMAVIQMCGFFFGQGAGNYVSRLLGQERTADAQRIASIGFFSSLIAGSVIMLIGLVFGTPLCYLLGSTETILPYARSYLLYISLGAPFMCASFMLNNLLRFQGNAFYGMLGMGIGGLLNVALDPLFIFVLDMGVAGAALATAISQSIGFVILLFCCTRGDNLRIRWRLFRPNRADCKAIVQGGLPNLFRQGLSSFSTICLNLAAGRVGGDAAIAAMSIATRIMQFSFYAVLGFGQGFQPVCGFNYGAGQYSRVKKAFWFCVKIGVVLLTVTSVLECVFARQLVGIFSGDEQVLSIGTTSLRLLCISFPPIAWTTMSTMLMQTIGRVFSASLLSASRQGLFFIPAVLLLPLLFGESAALLGVQMAQPLADVLTFVISVPLTLRVLHTFGEDQPLTL